MRFGRKWISLPLGSLGQCLFLDQACENTSLILYKLSFGVVHIYRNRSEYVRENEMISKKDEFNSTSRYKKLRKLIEKIDQQSSHDDLKSYTFDLIVEFLNLPNLGDKERIAKIKSVVSTYKEDQDDK